MGLSDNAIDDRVPQQSSVPALVSSLRSSDPRGRPLSRAEIISPALVASTPFDARAERERMADELLKAKMGAAEMTTTLLGTTGGVGGANESTLNMSTFNPNFPDRLEDALRNVNDPKSASALTHLKTLLKRHGAFPEKHRPMIWRFLLKLPYNRASYEALAAKGVHPAYADLYDRYPIKS